MGGPTDQTPLLGGRKNDSRTATIQDDDSVLKGRDDGEISTLPVVIITMFALIGPFSFGYTLGYTSPTAAQMDIDLDLSPTEDSLFGSLVNVGAMIGAIVSGALTNGIGRMRSMQLACLPFILGWLLIGFCDSITSPVPMLYAGRIFTGIGLGMTSQATPMYLSEIAPARLRGMLGSSFQLSITVGILFVYGIGVKLAWKPLAFIGAGMPALLFVACFFMPPTPRWLVSKGRNDDAERSLQRLRGPRANIEPEFDDIEVSVRHQLATKASFTDIFDRQYLMPFVISFGLMTYQQFSGINSVILNSTTILASAGITNANSASLAVGGVQVGATVVAVLLMDRAGRRTLLLVSSIGMALTITLLGVVFYYKDHIGHPLPTALALVACIGYILMFSLGSGAIPWLIMSEIFPLRIAGYASSMATLLNWTLSFIVTETFKEMNDKLTNAGTFWFYGAICAVGAVFIAFVVPETKGKTLEEIEQSFRKQK